jgi:hypothetical protein
MRAIPLVCLTAALATLGACGSSSLEPSNVTGYWSGQMDNNASQTYQMYLTQTGDQLQGSVAYLVLSGTPDNSVSTVVETVPVSGTFVDGDIALASTCDTCTAFVDLSGRFVNSKTVRATLNGGSPSGAADFKFIGQVAVP